MSSNVSSLNRLLDILHTNTAERLPANSDMTYGTIVTIDPLSIKVDNLGLTLPADFFFLGQMCRPHRVTIPHKHEYNGQTTNGYSISQQLTNDVHDGINSEEFVTIDIYPTLAEGDKVLLFSFADGQKYYVAERLESEE